LLPRFDFVAGDGEHLGKITGFANCNWLQCVENGIDPLHVGFTHGDVWMDLAPEPDIGFVQTDWGFCSKAFRPGPDKGTSIYVEHHLLMPGISVGGSSGRRLVENSSGTPPTSARWSVPIDDTHTMILRVRFKPADNPGQYKGNPLGSEWKPIRVEPYKEYKESDNPTLGYTLPPVVPTEDATILDSMGPIVDRHNENLSVVDAGMRMLRGMYLTEVEKVRNGADPTGTVREDTKNRLIPITAYEYVVSAEERKRLQDAAA
jgi:5,5'-dehydrodivanillate O-demethylase